MQSEKFSHIIILILLIFVLAAACVQTEHGKNSGLSPTKKPALKIKSCRDCHPFKLDKNHNFSCHQCHAGQNGSNAKEAHKGMIAAPASPAMMGKLCGPCHAREVSALRSSPHFTLRRAVNLTRRAFGASRDLASLTHIPPAARPATPLQLADDMLRRRCLRCHLYYNGDPYPATLHGLGCAACHLSYKNDKLTSHTFLASPGDYQCQSCHYGNVVGADYYGRFEHNYNWDYRTPFSTSDNYQPPYGIRYHQLTPDIHQRRGMVCLDCHPGNQLMGQAKGPSCKACHLYKKGTLMPANITIINGLPWLTEKKDGRKHQIPQAVNPAHKIKKTACQVCHALWSFNDRGISLLRQDNDNFNAWLALTRQGDFEVEQQLDANLFQDNGQGGAVMTDKLNGSEQQGIWLKTYLSRRWEPVKICRDSHGILQVCRTILDLSLSYVNKDGKVILDAVKPTDAYSAPRPYTPHTTGRAGAFFRQRLKVN